MHRVSELKDILNKNFAWKQVSDIKTKKLRMAVLDLGWRFARW